MTISDELAARVESRRLAAGLATLDDAAEALIVYGLLADADDGGLSGRSDEELRDLIDEADASGPTEPWDGAEVRAEVLRRHALLRGR